MWANLASVKFFIKRQARHPVLSLCKPLTQHLFCVFTLFSYILIHGDTAEVKGGPDLLVKAFKTYVRPMLESVSYTHLTLPTIYSV